MSWEEDWTKDFRRPEETQTEANNEMPVQAQPDQPQIQAQQPVQPQIQAQQILQQETVQQPVQTQPEQPQIRAQQPIQPERVQPQMQQTQPQMNVPPVQQPRYYQQTQQSQRPPVQPTPVKTEKKKKEKKKSFGKTILKIIAVAACFGIVAGCLFEGTVYFMGKQLGLNTAETIEEAVGLGAEEEIPSVREEAQTASTPVTPANNVTVVTSDVSAVVEKAMPSLVAITNISLVEYNTFWGQSGVYESESAGSGIIVDQDEENLYIATNNHVVEDNNSITVQFTDGESAAARVRGTNKERDIAVVEVSLADLKPETKNAIRVAEIGDSTALKVGEPAIAIGNSLGYGQSVTAGVISALDREASAYDNDGSIITNTCIQTDAVINPGNSGGALLNAAGEVIGINEIKYSNNEIEAVSYAIPMSTAEPIIRSIITREAVADAGEAYLGVVGMDVTDDISEHYNMPSGVYVAQLPDNSPAYDAGIFVGDIIVAIDEETIRTNDDLQRVIGGYAPGTRVDVTVMRTDRGVYSAIDVFVELGARTD